MNYRTVGRSGLKVSEICLGAWINFGGRIADEETFAVLDAAVEEGINFLDTADVYSRGVSETIVGRALARDGKRDRVFLATKGYNKMDDTDPNAWGSHRFHLIKAWERTTLTCTRSTGPSRPSRLTRLCAPWMTW